MNRNFRLRLCGLMLLGAIWVLPAIAQMSPESFAAIDRSLHNFKTEYQKLPEKTRNVMDAPPRVAELADAWHRLGPRLIDPAFMTVLQNSRRPMAAPVGPLHGSLVQVTDNSVQSDLGYSALGGFSESETSSARCGNNIVVGFNDSGSVFETPLLLTGSGAESFSGYAYSSDGGKTFHDGGPLNPGTDPGWLLAGDPVLTCSDANTFHYSQIFYNFSYYSQPFISAVAVSTSTDGGKTFGPPVVAASKVGGPYNPPHFLDKPWSAVDPSNPKNIYVSYTDFDTSEVNMCFPGERFAIEFVASHDGGNTWSSPIVAQESCSRVYQGSQLGLDSTGTLYISWIDLGPNYPSGPRYIEAESYAKGKLSSPLTAATITPPGGGYYLQGGFRDGNVDMSMAINHSGGPSDGWVAFAWADGSNKTSPDPLSYQGFYGYSDVFLLEASNVSLLGNNLWRTVKVNSDTQPRFGRGHDHYQPSVTWGSFGVGVCWYDRRADPQNFAVGRYCAKTTNGGFQELNTGAAPFTPAHNTDELLNPVYMGDYDAISSDFLNQNPGFFTTFQVQVRGNPNIVGFSF